MVVAVVDVVGFGVCWDVRDVGRVGVGMWLWALGRWLGGWQWGNGEVG